MVRVILCFTHLLVSLSLSGDGDMSKYTLVHWYTHSDFFCNWFLFVQWGRNRQESMEVQETKAPYPEAERPTTLNIRWHKSNDIFAIRDWIFTQAHSSICRYSSKDVKIIFDYWMFYFLSLPWNFLPDPENHCLDIKFSFLGDKEDMAKVRELLKSFLNLFCNH